MQIPVSNLLFPEEHFVSNYPQTSFILEHLHKKTMVIDAVRVISTQKPVHGGYPIGSGLVFLADTPSVFQKSQARF